ncbi:unnamed protein product [Cuscuta epithymum]|uniref:La-related protein 6A n=1 Tax=Cuscuta epithymum TaxID=186058 RepID=A0AAV0G1P9_9ASTE|nr:unnamed protein product [Cuscuta epithymum]
MEPELLSGYGLGSGGMGIPTTSNSTIVATTSSPPPYGENDGQRPDYHEDPHHPSDQVPPFTAALSDDLRLNIIKQVEYYFSDANLLTDKFLLKYVTNNEEGFVPLNVIASFKRMKKLTKEIPLIVTALKESSLLVVSSDEKAVKRLNPLPYTGVRDPQLCTVLVENLPADHSVEDLKQLFSLAGHIQHISIREPQVEISSKKCSVAEKLLSGKLHALVEFDTKEAAVKAVATLNDEQDWRFGLRVKLLMKEGKRPQKKKVWRESGTDRHTCGEASSDQAVDEESCHPSEQHGDSHDEKDGGHLPKETIGEHVPKEKDGHAGRSRGRGRRQKCGANVQVQGMRPSPAHGTETSKPPPGPRMPDGTRGFTMGRGKASISL